MFYTIDEGNKFVNVIRFLYRRRDWKNILNKNEMEYSKNHDDAKH